MAMLFAHASRAFASFCALVGGFEIVRPLTSCLAGGGGMRLPAPDHVELEGAPNTGDGPGEPTRQPLSPAHGGADGG